MDPDPADRYRAGPLTEPERAAVRAYLQRSEVRLSTVHRVATALLSLRPLRRAVPRVATVLPPVIFCGVSTSRVER